MADWIMPVIDRRTVGEAKHTVWRIARKVGDSMMYRDVYTEINHLPPGFMTLQLYDNITRSSISVASSRQIVPHLLFP